MDENAVISQKYCTRNAFISRFHLPCVEIKGDTRFLSTRFLSTICGYMDYIEESSFQHPSPSLSGNFPQKKGAQWAPTSILLNAASKFALGSSEEVGEEGRPHWGTWSSAEGKRFHRFFPCHFLAPTGWEQSYIKHKEMCPCFLW